MRQIVHFIFFLSLSQTVLSQKVDKSTFTRISKQLVDSYLETDYLGDKNIIREGDCIIGKNEGFTLSCISTNWDSNWTTDFDGDSICDLVIQVIDEGLGGGGNAFGYHFSVVTLDSNQNIKEIYTLFGGGKFSYALLTIDRVNRGTIHATYEQNPNAYDFEDVNFDKKEQLSLEFSLVNNALQEKNYPKCPIALMNKNIFRDDTNYEIERSISLDDSFNITQEEKLHTSDKSYYLASISGCEDIELFFTQTIPYDKSLEKDKSSIMNIWLRHAKFYKENTRYKTVLKELHEQLLAIGNDKVELQQYGGAHNEFNLSNNWKAFLFVSGNKEQGSFVTIRLLKTITTEPLEFWESIKRKNKLN